MVGRKVGRFHVLAKIGQGGMATVWKARDELLGREVALKILDEKLANEEKARRRFLHEARTAASLDHPGAVGVFDSGESEGIAFIAMRLVDGETLAERVDRSLLPISEAVRIGAAVADVLSHAHQRGVVHRDISSRNVMIGRDGRVFVLDFGLALANWESRISSSGTTPGTFPYMAPEVLLEQDADPRSDLYGLGVVLYEALTGTVPHGRERPAATAYAIIHGEPTSPRQRRPEISEALERLVLKSIAREPSARHQSAEELAVELRSMIGAESPPQPVVHATRPVVESRVARDPSEVTRPHPLYLAVRPVALASISEDREGEAAAAARHLTDFLASALSRYSDIRIVSPGVDAGEGEPREIARSLGANAVLSSSISRSGSRLRVAYQVLDPWRDVVVVGDVVEGAIGQVFDLADKVVHSVAEALGLGLHKMDVVVRPSDPAARDRYATALGYLKRYDDEASLDGAIRLLEGLVASEGSAEYHASLARAFVHKYRLTWQRGWEARAAAACQRAKALDPDGHETLLALGDLEWATGNPEAARADYARVIDQRPELFEAHIGMSRALEALGKSDDAKAAIDRAIALRSDDWRGYNRLGVHFFDRGEYPMAAEAWHRVTELAPDQARGWFNRGIAAGRMDRFEDSIVHFRRSIEIQPTALAYGNLGTAFYYLSRFEEAVSALQKATELNPLDPLQWGDLGNAYRWIPGHETECARALERAIDLGHDFLTRNPKDVKFRAKMAGWLANRGRNPEAREAIRLALEMDSRNPDCMVRAGHIFFQLGDRAEALKWIGEAVRHGYGVAELRASQELSPLRGDPEFERILKTVAAQPPTQASADCSYEKERRSP